MNVERNHEQGGQFQNEAYQPASGGGGGGKFLKYGCGCLGIMFLMCGIGGVVSYFMFGEQLAAAAKMGMEYQTCIIDVQNTEAVTEKLGSPISPDILAQPTQEANGDAISMTYDTPIEGPNGSGIMHVKFTMSGGNVTRDEFWVEIDGERIEMEGNGALDFDVDDGNSEDGSTGAVEEVPLMNEGG